MWGGQHIHSGQTEPHEKWGQWGTAHISWADWTPWRVEIHGWTSTYIMGRLNPTKSPLYKIIDWLIKRTCCWKSNYTKTYIHSINNLKAVNSPTDSKFSYYFTPFNIRTLGSTQSSKAITKIFTMLDLVGLPFPYILTIIIIESKQTDRWSSSELLIEFLKLRTF